MLSPSGVRLRKHAQQKYDAILQSAHRLFLKHGYTTASMDMIAAEAGVSKQTIYSYFSSKDALFCRMIETDCEHHSPPETMLSDPKLKPEEALFRIGRGFIDLLINHRGLATYRLVMSEAERHPRIAKLFYESGPIKMNNMLAQYLERQRDLGVFEIEDAYKTAVNFFSIVKGPFHLKMLLKIKPAPTKKEVDDHIRETIKKFFRIYGKR